MAHTTINGVMSDGGDMGHTAYIGFGGNLGAPAATLRRGVEALAAAPGVCVECGSRLYRSAPVDCDAAQPDYINAVCRLSTSLTPMALLALLFDIETTAGRERSGGINSARTLDLDLLLYDDHCCNDKTLTLPHPRLGRRRFVLEPLYEIAPELVIPRLGALPPLLDVVRDQDCLALEAPALLAAPAAAGRE